ncbi:hypothetical protein C942_03277 [Photobacterium marinum]|uniref:Uncharacterized protein n=1 Tax=Photobacterium marinum TaxID=1056511 RepID=L8J6L3_9GAMM|nr:hypothetical protein C942_03277 [Photobacterium marinum]
MLTGIIKGKARHEVWLYFDSQLSYRVVESLLEYFSYQRASPS